MKKYNCKYCQGRTASPREICSNCKEKVDVIARIFAMLGKEEN